MSRAVTVVAAIVFTSPLASVQTGGPTTAGGRVSGSAREGSMVADPEGGASLEQAKLRLEERKALYAAIAGVVPLLAAIGTIAFGVWSVRTQARLTAQARAEEAKQAEHLRAQEALDSFRLKAAELVLAAPGATEARNRSLLLRQLFPDRLEPDFGNSIDAKELGRLQLPQGPIELLRLIASNPEHKDIVIRSWVAIFGGDDFARQAASELGVVVPARKDDSSGGDKSRVAERVVAADGEAPVEEPGHAAKPFAEQSSESHTAAVGGSMEAGRVSREAPAGEDLG